MPFRAAFRLRNITSGGYGGLFLWSAVAKARSFDDFEQSIEEIGRFGNQSRLVARSILVGEAMIGFLGFTRPRLAIRASLVALNSFSVVAGVAAAKGRQPTCQCFGALSKTKIGKETILRNSGLSAPGVVYFLTEGGLMSHFRNVSTSTNGRTLRVLGWSAVAMVEVLRTVQLVKLLRTVATLESNSKAGGLNVVADMEENLGLGQKLPRIELSKWGGALTTVTKAVDEFDLMTVVFIDPIGCTKCLELIEPLMQASIHMPIDQAIVVVTTTPGEEARAKFDALATVTDRLSVLTQSSYEFFESAGIRKVPSAVVVNQMGTIVSPVARGYEQVLHTIHSSRVASAASHS